MISLEAQVDEAVIGGDLEQFKARAAALLASIRFALYELRLGGSIELTGGPGGGTAVRVALPPAVRAPVAEVDALTGP